MLSNGKSATSATRQYERAKERQWQRNAVQYHSHKRRRRCDKQQQDEAVNGYGSKERVNAAALEHALTINKRDNKRRRRNRLFIVPSLMMIFLSVAIPPATAASATPQQFNHEQQRRRQRQRNHDPTTTTKEIAEDAAVTLDLNPSEPILAPISIATKETPAKESEEFIDSSLIIEKDTVPIVAVNQPAPGDPKPPPVIPPLDLDETYNDGDPKNPPLTFIPDDGSNIQIIEKEGDDGPVIKPAVPTYDLNDGEEDGDGKPLPYDPNVPVPANNVPAPGDAPVVTTTYNPDTAEIQNTGDNENVPYDPNAPVLSTYDVNDGEDGLDEDTEEDFEPPLLQGNPTVTNQDEEPSKEDISEQPLKEDDEVGEALRACQSSTLSSPLESTTGSFGNVFNVRTPSNNPGVIIITSLDFYTDLPEMVTYEVYTKPGTYVGYAGNLTAWTLISSGTATGRGSNATTPIPPEEFTSVSMSPDSTQAFYITLTSRDVRYKPGNGEPNVPDGMVQTFSEELELWEGAGVLQYPFGDLYSEPRQFLGRVNYLADWKTCEPTSTPVPSSSPSMSVVPSVAPSVVNSTVPTSMPTMSISPSSIPTVLAVSVPTITTRVRFEFYISRPAVPTFLISNIKKRIETSVEEIINGVLQNNETEVVDEHGLMVEDVTAFGSDEPCTSGDTSKVCSTIVANIILQHSETLSTEEAEHIMVLYYDHVSSNLPYKVETVSTQAEIVISLAGVPTDRVMTKEEIYVFERAAASFLTDADDFESNEVDILDVKVVGQALYVNGVIIQNTQSKVNDTEWVMASKDNDGPSRRNLEHKNKWGTIRRVRILNETDPTPSSKLDVFTMVTGAYVPPPEQNLPRLAVNSFDSDSAGFVRDLKEEASKEGVESVSNFFDDISGIEVMSEELAIETEVTPAPTPAPEKDGWYDNGAAKIVALTGGIVSVVLVVIGLVSLRKWKRLRSDYDQTNNKESDTDGEDNGEEGNINVVDEFDSGDDHDNNRYDDLQDGNGGDSNPFDYDNDVKVPPQRSFKSQHSLRNGSGGLGVEDDLLHHMFNKPNI